MFHPLEGLTRQEHSAANVRVFEGDGTPYLRVPGLRKLESVRVGTVVVPLSTEIEIPEDHTLTRLRRIPVPLLDVQETPEGERILLRSQMSNDGVWQTGVKVYVAGDWDDAAQPVAVTQSKSAKG